MLDYLLVFLTAMAPIAELRGAIPLGVVKNLNIWLVYFIAVLGNLIPVIFILLLAKFFCPKWLCIKIKKKHKHKFAKFGDLALISFTAIPLPFTGAWTASLVAVVFRIKFWRAFILISIGVIMSGVIVLLLSLSLWQANFLNLLP